jgi:hypothetical protein
VEQSEAAVSACLQFINVLWASSASSNHAQPLYSNLTKITDFFYGK